jgi:ribonuclease Z
LHEATGKHPVHSSAEEAAQLARSAQARRLVLVHLPPSDQLTAEELDKARQVFPNLEVGQELGCLPF